MTLQKNIFGAWGADLSDHDYACAVAAVGVLESFGELPRGPELFRLVQECISGERAMRWGEGLDIGTEPPTWFWSAPQAAEFWADYIRQLPSHERWLPRLALSTELRRSASTDFDVLCAWLRHFTPGLGALVIEPPLVRPLEMVRWHWPLHVGVFDDPAMNFALDLAERQHSSWIPQLTRRVEVGAVRDSCDLLLATPTDVEALLRRERTRVRASVIVCLDDAHPDVLLLGDLYSALAERLGCAGIAWIGRHHSPQETADWFQSVIRHVSHDVPIATALSMVPGFPRPTLIGDALSLDRCRILAIADRQDRTIVGLGGQPAVGRNDPVTDRLMQLFLSGIDDGRHSIWSRSFGRPDTGAARRPSPPGAPIRERPELKITPPPSPLRGLTGDLADDLRRRSFTSETTDGRRSAAELKSRDRVLHEARPPRWIQAQGWRTDAPEHAARCFAKERWNLLAVHIGPSDLQRADPSFPSAGLDFSQGDVALKVQLELTDASVREFGNIAPSTLTGNAVPALAQSPPPAPRTGATVPGLSSADISLPDVGNSTAALFGVYPHADVAEIAGRVAIMHNNRVLQTAKVTVPIGDRIDVGDGVNIVVDQVIHAHDDDLDERREYDVAIRVGDVGGKIHLAIQDDDTATPVELENLESPIETIRTALNQIADKYDYSKPMLDQQVFHDRLFTLAAKGKLLEQHLRRRCGNQIDEWQRIHLVPTTNQFFPLEYVYDGPPPQHHARVCPNSLDALRAGSCDVALSGNACGNQADKQFICPLKFWGFSRLIERSAPPDKPAPVKLTCTPSKDPYGKVSSLLYAASSRAFKYVTGDAEVREQADLVEALSALCKPIPAITDWNQWRTEVKKQPNLLVLVVHAEQQLGIRMLEIGNGAMLNDSEILRDITGEVERPLLVLLLGCSVANVHEDFQPFPELFFHAGAKIVLAPISLIRGRDAVLIAKRLSALLAQHLSSTKPTTFGDLLSLLRRELLSQGYPGILGLVGFGDGDWILGGPDVAH